LEKAGHVPAAEKLRQLQALGAQLYACGSSLEHFHVDPKRLDFEDVIVCEYLTSWRCCSRPTSSSTADCRKQVLMAPT
jgi:hypothetical protein